LDTNMDMDIAMDMETDTESVNFNGYLRKHW
jgi:hypothetical protein